MFWSESMIELAASGDHDSHVVVADWLEERDCKVAAECFRRQSYAVWRVILLEFAKAAPEVAPRGMVLEVLDTQVAVCREMNRRMEEARTWHMQFGFDISGALLKTPEWPTLRDLRDAPSEPASAVP